MLRRKAVHGRPEQRGEVKVRISNISEAPRPLPFAAPPRRRHYRGACAAAAAWGGCAVRLRGKTQFFTDMDLVSPCYSSQDKEPHCG